MNSYVAPYLVLHKTITVKMESNAKCDIVLGVCVCGSGMETIITSISSSNSCWESTARRFRCVFVVFSFFHAINSLCFVRNAKNAKSFDEINHVIVRIL